MPEETIAPPIPKSPLYPNTLLSVTALARFEFEPGRGNEGTKVMMVEWQDDDETRATTGSWHVSWSGKRTVFPADDNPSDNIRRVYFLLPPGSIVPPHITIAYTKPWATAAEPVQPLRLSVNALPAIFTPELGATAKASGKKGVLHTIWAKKRLQVLGKEIQQEQAHNLEGIALEMAVAEKEWIENNFGLQQKPPNLNLGATSDFTAAPMTPGLQSPKSPGGRRLSEKLKGLSIGTSEKDLAAKGVNTVTREVHPLSPEGSDMVYSSFSAFRNGPTSPPSAPLRKIVSQSPPDHLRKQQMQSPPASLMSQISWQNDKNEDDLFAVAMSPRSPGDPKSPFSLSSAEVGAFSKIKGEQRP